MKKHLCIITLSLCLLLSACGNSSTSVVEGNGNASTESSSSVAMDAVSASDNTMAEGAAEPEEISVQTTEESEETTEDSLMTEVTSVETTEDSVAISVDALMTDFMNGALNGVQFGDGSEAAKNYQTWYDLLGGECVPSEASSPQEYWDIWSEHVERLYTANSYEFLVEQEYPISAKYIELKYGIDG